MMTLQELCTFIYTHPELGFNEFEAARVQKEFLEERGFTVEFPYSDKLKTAFRSEFVNGDGPTIIFMSEYDALKGLGHACGHNLIAAAALKAFTDTVEAMRKNDIKGKIILLGTPAEEGYGGKCFLIEEHAFDNADIALISHPFEVAGIGPSTMGISHLQVEFFGKSAHASMAPEYGLNALDAMISFFNAIGLYRQQMAKSCQVHGVITDGGKAPNIIPDYTKALFYTRSHIHADHKKIDEDFIRMAQGAAMSANCTCKVSHSSPRYEPSKSVPALEKVLAEEMQNSGLKLSEITLRLSSDFGNVANVLPTANIFFPVSENSLPKLHTTEFYEAAGTEYAFEQSMKAGSALAKTAVKYLTDAEFRKSVSEN